MNDASRVKPVPPEPTESKRNENELHFSIDIDWMKRTQKYLQNEYL
jgi:hypothetical protein